MVQKYITTTDDLFAFLRLYLRDAFVVALKPPRNRINQSVVRNAKMQGIRLRQRTNGPRNSFLCKFPRKYLLSMSGDGRVSRKKFECVALKYLPSRWKQNSTGEAKTFKFRRLREPPRNWVSTEKSTTVIKSQRCKCYVQKDVTCAPKTHDRPWESTQMGTPNFPLDQRLSRCIQTDPQRLSVYFVPQLYTGQKSTIYRSLPSLRLRDLYALNLDRYVISCKQIWWIWST